MADEIDTLLARARRLEEENTLLRSMQSPTGDDAALQAENVLLRTELARIRRSPGGAPPAPKLVSPRPGAIQFTLIPEAAVSFARTRVKPTTPALAAA